MIEVKNLCKTYPKFKLDNVSFSLDEGYILGFIGKNGAGKTTTIKSILNLTSPDSGEIRLLGKDVAKDEIEIKKEIGFTLGEIDYYPNQTIKKIAKVFSSFFDNWDDALYRKYLEKFSIDENKKIKELSSGMRVKLSIAFSLSHNAKLLIFDEPTSGLDPIAREELLQIFREVVSGGDKSILFSTHITSDLDKCADYILFIEGGKIVLDETKDDMIDSHILVAGAISELTDELKSKLIGYKTNAFGFNGLMKKSDNTFDALQVGKPNIEDIMVFYNANWAAEE